MSKKIIWGIVGVVVLVGVFFGGMTYGKSEAASKASVAGAAFAGARTRGAGGSFGGATIGQIISKDNTSITVKTTDGSSKIVYFSDSTQIGKSVSGASSDLNTGEQVMVTGTTGSDGSTTAQSIQIRPDQPAAQPAN